MRVIAGSKKGLRLVALKSSAIRPTSDRTKELIFNVLMDVVPGAGVLDLFAGTGSLGIEALSRGAVKAIFIENSAGAQRVLQQNLEKTGFVQQSKIIRIAVQPALRQLARQETQFSLVLADPPYGDMTQEILAAVARSNVIAAGGWFVLEHSGREGELRNDTNLSLHSYKRVGDSAVSFFRRYES